MVCYGALQRAKREEGGREETDREKGGENMQSVIVLPLKC